MPAKTEPLKDRQIYRRPSAIAYVGSMFVHAWDESASFWETKRKGLIIQLLFLGLGTHVWALVRGWDYAMNEILLGTLITVGPPVIAALLLYLLGVLKAPWRLHISLLRRLAELPTSVEHFAMSSRCMELAAVAADAGDRLDAANDSIGTMRSEIHALRQSEASLRHDLVQLATKASALESDAASAAVRAEYSSGSISITNIGKAEATQIFLRPVSFGSFPWSLQSREVGSLPNSCDEPLPLIFSQGTGECRLCMHQGRPENLDDLLVKIGDHIEHELVSKPPGTANSDLENQYIMYGIGAVPRAFSVFFAIEFDSGSARRATFSRLDIRYRHAEGFASAVFDVRCVFLRNEDSGEPVRISSPTWTMAEMRPSGD